MVPHTVSLGRRYRQRRSRHPDEADEPARAADPDDAVLGLGKAEQGLLPDRPEFFYHVGDLKTRARNPPRGAAGATGLG